MKDIIIKGQKYKKNKYEKEYTLYQNKLNTKRDNALIFTDSRSVEQIN